LPRLPVSAVLPGTTNKIRVRFAALARISHTKIRKRLSLLA
jgi:hypothetical protein